ncbi:SDR family NAD(P)-dependent oxidoreductase [Bacteroides caecigallinarum]|uniref:SDR family NAD(P)-dependent oxidoreductase n=1 Tax=Bacteroides caecigallinarum TaxID=1411144 RepID=UPI001957953E|nr:SDR family NAD(P)-dependent oxidoreductase [Bacteroides caecigallinarum]MBM6882439.1 SDR family NAD(P)-dependent oxidoreductase [Bacteroides caecigallinarum]
MINKTKRAVIMGATSGIGYEVARLLLSEGWKLGLAGRREENLRKLQSEFPGQVCIKAIDVKDEDAGNALFSLIDELGGMDMYFHSSGIGHQNANLDADIELNTLETNGTGFTRMVGAAFRYFRDKGKGHIAVISSIAGTKGLGIAPAYSATKRFQNTYIDALEQLASMKKLDIRFTDIRPGFVATNLLNDGKKYPMLMKTDYTARLIVKALNSKKRIAVIDWKYRILVFFWRLIPRCVWKRMSVKN